MARPSAGCAWTNKTMPANRSPKRSRSSAWRRQSLPLRARSLTNPGQSTGDDPDEDVTQTTKFLARPAASSSCRASSTMHRLSGSHRPTRRNPRLRRTPTSIIRNARFGPYITPLAGLTVRRLKTGDCAWSRPGAAGVSAPCETPRSARAVRHGSRCRRVPAASP
jgi:hypothetical protein